MLYVPLEVISEKFKAVFKLVRQNRPGSLQTRGQIAACDDFESYVLSARHWPTEDDNLATMYASQRPTTVKRTQGKRVQLF